MSFMSFQGRIGRGMWWLTGVLQLLLVAGAIAYVAAVDAAEDPRTGWQGPVFFLIVLFTAWIGLCANIKRYHDRGKSGFWVLICFVPFVGPIWMFIELGFLRGVDGPNSFGSPSGSGLAPLGGSQAAVATEAPVNTSSLAKLDDAYFRDYAATKAAAAKTEASSKPSGARSGKAARGTFGKRGVTSPA